jgi:hypothetical protein
MRSNPLSGTSQWLWPPNILLENPPFSEYHFIDANPRRAEQLRRLIGERNDVFIESADCNDVLIQSVIYYLYFASQKPVAANIVDDIFNKYRQR